MRRAWARVRPDLALWLALAALMAVAGTSLPGPLTPDAAQPTEPPPLLPLLVLGMAGMVSTMLPSVVFTAQLVGHQLTWGPAFRLMARRALPLFGYALVATSIAWAADLAMLLGVTMALGNSPALIPLSTIAAAVIFVSILVRFCFLPFLVILLERDQMPESLWSWQRLQGMAPMLWPLTASARLTEGLRWRLAFYAVLERALPVGAAVLPGPWRVPATIAVVLVLTMVQAVYYEHFLARLGSLGVARPRLPLELERNAD